VLIEGASGAGKSDLALRLIDRGATLISDDYTILTHMDGNWSPLRPIRSGADRNTRTGHHPAAPYRPCPRCVIGPADGKSREDADGQSNATDRGVDIREVAIDARSASAAIKVELALKHLTGASA